MTRVLLGLGANVPGTWGTPRETLKRATCAIQEAGLALISASHIYSSAPLGLGRQPPYLNAVIAVEGRLSPAAILKLAKQLERRAGRRLGRNWGPRPLDIDVLDYHGTRSGHPAPRRRGGLILPHPEMHKRAFVLIPLLEIAPHWRHPALGLCVGALLRRIDRRLRSEVRQTLDFAASLCHNSRE